MTFYYSTDSRVALDSQTGYADLSSYRLDAHPVISNLFCLEGMLGFP